MEVLHDNGFYNACCQTQRRRKFLEMNCRLIIFQMKFEATEISNGNVLKEWKKIIFRREFLIMVYIENGGFMNMAINVHVL
jgi:hypothetical protein